MGTLEFSIYTKRAFDTQEGGCHLGERLSQLFCLRMEKMKNQLNNRLRVEEGAALGKMATACPSFLKEKKKWAFVEERRSK